MTAASSLMLVISLLAIFIMAAFLAVYLYDRSQKAALWWLTGFLVAMVNPVSEFLIPFVDDPRPLLLAISVSFVSMLGFQAIGICAYYEKRPPLKLIIGLIALGAVLWIAIIDMPRNSLLRIALHMSPYLVMQCVSIWLLAMVKPLRGLDKVFLAALVFGALHYACRPVLAYILGGVGETPQDYLNTHYATVMLIWITVVVLSTATVMFMLVMRKVLHRLTHQSFVDPLSGLLNRRGLDHAFQTHAKAMSSTGQNGKDPGYCVIICDVDHFKQINDTFGHDTGDVIIIKLSQYLENLGAREEQHNIVARVGGEEFAAVIWGCSQSEAAYKADLLRKGIGAVRHEEMGGKSVTVSIGVADHKPGQTFRDVTMAADAALYKAKQNGRNRVETASSMRRKSDDLIRKWEKHTA